MRLSFITIRNRVFIWTEFSSPVNFSVHFHFFFIHVSDNHEFIPLLAYYTCSLCFLSSLHIYSRLCILSCAFPWVKWRSAEVMHNLFSSGSCLLHSYNSSIYMFVCVEEGEERLPDYQLTHHTYLRLL